MPRTIRSLLLFLLFSIFISASIRAEKADKDKPLHIEANQMFSDDIKQINIFTGNVILTKGTTLIKADKAIIKQNQEGYFHVTLYASPDKLVLLRTQRDGGSDLWTEGYGEKVEYDTKSDVAKFFKRGHIRYLEGSKVTDEVMGEFISYNNKTEFVQVHNTSSGISVPNAGRVKAIIQPRDTKQDERK